MALAQRHADLTVELEAADAGAVAGARVDDDIGALPVDRRHVVGRRDAQQAVIAGAVEVAPVHRDLMVVDQHRRAVLRLVLQKDVAALAERVERQRPALDEIGRVGRGRFLDVFGGASRHAAQRLADLMRQLARPRAVVTRDPVHMGRQRMGDGLGLAACALGGFGGVAQAPVRQRRVAFGRQRRERLRVGEGRARAQGIVGHDGLLSR
jgi:hypothetical protein